MGTSWVIVTCLILWGLFRSGCDGYFYRTKYFLQKVDHFAYANNDTFKQRYLINDAHWNKNGGPIFFYTGNEGDIEMFANNTGFMWEIAPEFQALLIFAEHRYYGQSMPYGEKSLQKLEYLGYLTVEQALADYITLIDYIKLNTPGAAKSKVVAFGGSYGGMLASWIRIKYPHAIVGSLASSAPIAMFPGMAPCETYFQIITKSFQKASAACAESIRQSWSAVRRIAKDDSGRQWLSRTFRLCNRLQENDVDTFVSWLTETWGNLAMVDYPYPTSFLVPLPGYPIKETCKYLPNPKQGDEDLVGDIFRAVSVFQNYTGDTKCFDISQSGGASLGDNAWDFQSCTEMVMPTCSDGMHDMFEPSPWDFNLYAKQCEKKWGVSPEARKAIQMFGGRNLNFSSNIIFSNGQDDPWSAGGILKSISDTVIAILIPDAAHHLDLRSANRADPPEVISARQLEKKIIRSWLN